jgi:hypothetical protein
MTTTEKLTLLLNQANEDFSNVECGLKGEFKLLANYDLYYVLTHDYFELRIKEQL